MQARRFAAEFGRFLSVDPLADDFAGWTPYHYVHNNPLIFVDPDGRAPVVFAIPFLVKAGKAAVVAYKAKTAVTVTAGAGTAFAQGAAASGLIMAAGTGIIAGPEDAFGPIDWPVDLGQTHEEIKDPTGGFEEYIRNPKNHDTGKTTSPPPGSKGPDSRLVKILKAITGTGIAVEAVRRNLNSPDEIQLQRQRVEDNERKKEAEELINRVD